MKKDIEAREPRRLARAEKIVLAIMALAAAFTLGYFAGRSAGHGGTMTVETQKSTVVAETQEQTAKATEEAVTEPPSPGATASGEPNVQDGLVNINTATVEELMTLPGVGEVIARRIIDFRETYGGFKIIDEIADVSGIGDATFENIKDLITVGGG